MQFVWVHVGDLVGKGVEMKVLLEFFLYAVTSVVPLALPLAILLASLMTFGNLGEDVELTAMKAAGISLFRIMRPLMISIFFICGGAFLFSNYVLPVSQVKLWALIFSLRQKSPELEIPQGEFYGGIDGYNIYVRHKNPNKGMLYDLMIYDYSQGFQNATVMVADSGKIYFTDDKKYLFLCLYSGESFENLDRQQKRAVNSIKNIPYRREIFSQKQILIDFDMEFSRFSEDMLSDQHVSKNVTELLQSIDSVEVLAHTRSAEQSAVIVESRYFGRERQSGRNIAEQAVGAPSDRVYDLDTLLASFSPDERFRAASAALEKAKTQRDQVDYNALMLNDYQRYIRRHEIELHRKFTLAFACLVFFFIGAPMGAITRKGGLGMPVVISVVMFIIYYVIDNTGYKMAREALWPCWMGMWLSSFVLLPVGVFLTYKAATDSTLFNIDAWRKIFRKLKIFIKKIWILLNKLFTIFVKAILLSSWMTKIVKTKATSSSQPKK